MQLLRETLGDKTIDYKNLGGYELFLDSDRVLYETCLGKQAEINKLLQPLFNSDVFSFRSNNFGFKNITEKISFNQFEGQIDTGKMMKALLNKATNTGIKILNNCQVEAIEDGTNSVKIKTSLFEFKSNKVFIATNGFASQLIEQPVKPARAQVLITKPINKLQIKGTFHLDQGYYYFNVNLV